MILVALALKIAMSLDRYRESQFIKESVTLDSSVAITQVPSTFSAAQLSHKPV